MEPFIYIAGFIAIFLMVLGGFAMLGENKFAILVIVTFGVGLIFVPIHTVIEMVLKVGFELLLLLIMLASIGTELKQRAKKKAGRAVSMLCNRLNEIENDFEGRYQRRTLVQACKLERTVVDRLVHGISLGHICGRFDPSLNYNQKLAQKWPQLDLPELNKVPKPVYRNRCSAFWHYLMETAAVKFYKGIKTAALRHTDKIEQSRYHYGLTPIDPTWEEAALAQEFQELELARQEEVDKIASAYDEEKAELKQKYQEEFDYVDSEHQDKVAELENQRKLLRQMQ